MDGQRFDALTRLVAAGTSRRRFAAGLAGALATAVLGARRTVAEKAKTRLCHATGDPANPYLVIEVAPSAAADHLGHGDFAYTNCCTDAACAAPQTCGGGGVAGTCGCTPDNAAACAGRACGAATNNCGQTVACGEVCNADQVCANDGCCDFFGGEEEGEENFRDRTCGAGCCRGTAFQNQCDVSEGRCCYVDGVCGAPGNEFCCPSDQYCPSGTCVAYLKACADTTVCNPGETCLNGVCCLDSRVCGDVCCGHDSHCGSPEVGCAADRVVPTSGLRRF